MAWNVSRLLLERSPPFATASADGASVVLEKRSRVLAVWPAAEKSPVRWLAHSGFPVGEDREKDRAGGRGEEIRPKARSYELINRAWGPQEGGFCTLFLTPHYTVGTLEGAHPPDGTYLQPTSKPDVRRVAYVCTRYTVNDPPSLRPLTTLQPNVADCRDDPGQDGRDLGRVKPWNWLGGSGYCFVSWCSSSRRPPWWRPCT